MHDIDRADERITRTPKVALSGQARSAVRRKTTLPQLNALTSNVRPDY